MARFVCNMISYTLQRTVDLTVIVPSTTIPEALGINKDGKCATHVVKEPYPVLYLLHGRGNNHADWGSYTNIELFAEERNMAVAMISGENKAYRDVPEGDRYFEFLQKEVPEFVTNYFPITKDPVHSYIAGLSMGGYGALLHGLTYPERFAAIGAFSAAVLSGGKKEVERLSDGPMDVRYLVRTAREQGKQIPPVYLACGEDDFAYPRNCELHALMKEQGFDVTWDSLPGYQHEWRFWNIQIEKLLDWLPRTDVYAKDKRRV